MALLVNQIIEITGGNPQLVEQIVASYDTITDLTFNEIITLILSSTEAEIYSWLKRHPPKLVRQQVNLVQAPPNNLIIEELPEPEYECFTCVVNFAVSKMYTVSCNESHRLCFECAKEYVDHKLAEKSFIACPGARCTYQFTPADLKHIGYPDNTVKEYDQWLTSKVLEQSAIACPGRDCGGFIYPSDETIKEPYTCTMCNFISCTKCKREYHYRSECNDLPTIESRWHSWCAQGRDSYWAQKNQEVRALSHYEENRQKHLQNVAEINERYKDLNKDEEYKQQHCKLCPNCGRTVEKLSGCDSMKCGRNYHGGEVQNGCGASFSWLAAPPYVASQVALKDQSYNVPQPKVTELVVHQFYQCGVCAGEIKGIRFSCLNCPCFDVCETCDVRGDGLHLNHIFVLHTRSQ